MFVEYLPYQIPTPTRYPFFGESQSDFSLGQREKHFLQNRNEIRCIDLVGELNLCPHSRKRKPNNQWQQTLYNSYQPAQRPYFAASCYRLQIERRMTAYLHKAQRSDRHQKRPHPPHESCNKKTVRFESRVLQTRLFGNLPRQI